MRKDLLFILLLFTGIIPFYGQQTVGLFLNTPASFDGYTLFGPQHSKETFLINNCGEKVHSWTSQYYPGLSSYLMENGTLLHTGRIPGMGGGSGIVEMLDWNSNVIWSYSVSQTHGRQHHDIELLPNGNILLIVWDKRTQNEVIQAGSSTTTNYINSEQIVEIQPDLVNGGGTVVWEWKAWDHLIQDADATKDNYGIVGDHPEKIDVNFLNHNSTDWLHANGIDYNAELDQIILSVRSFNEFWIIDHSTTMAEASSSSGGTYGKGGDLLYRWGNPQAYHQGSSSDQKLFLQHDTQWIADSLEHGGEILVYNNQAGTPVNQNYSAVHSIQLPVNSAGEYTYTSGAYLPQTYNWTYQAPIPTDFYSNIISGVQRLANGNTLICQGVGGRFFEVTSNGELVWEYINPVNDLGVVNQGDPHGDNHVFRCVRYAVDFPGFNGQNLESQGHIESGTTSNCMLYPIGNQEWNLANEINLYPNPVENALNLKGIYEDVLVEAYTLNGQRLYSRFHGVDEDILQLDVSTWEEGLYFISVRGKSSSWQGRFVK